MAGRKTAATPWTVVLDLEYEGPVVVRVYGKTPTVAVANARAEHGADVDDSRVAAVFAGHHADHWGPDFETCPDCEGPELCPVHDGVAVTELDS